MSWLRNAVHRAVEASGGPLLTRTVRSSLGTVVHHAGQAVAGGARLINDRIGSRSYKSMRLTAKRLEDAALSYRGEDRVQLLRRWLVMLRETQRAAAAEKEAKRAGHPDQHLPVLDLYMDYETGAEPMNFIHVFLYSQALECLVLSMIMEFPTEEEASLLSEVFGLCLPGGKDVHNAILSSIKELAKLFSTYHDEVLAKRAELLQFAQCAISGLKINPEISRLDDEILQLQQRINGMDALRSNSTSRRSKASQTVAEGFRTAVNEIRLCSRMEELVLMKKSMHHGNSFETYFEKVNKLKVLSESLANSAAKAERRIMENRLQKEESLIFRVTKTNEVSVTEKEILAEISGLQKQKDLLEDELKKVNNILNAAVMKLKKTREERDQFDEASNQIVLHLKAKEEELSRSIASCKVESSTVGAWIIFLEDTWKLQSLYEELRKKQANDELDKCATCFAKLINHHLYARVEELSTCIDSIKTFVDNLKIFDNRSVSAEDGNNGSSKQSNPRKYLEEEYLEAEKKVVAAFSLVDNIRAIYLSNQDYQARRDDPDVKKLFANIDKLRVEFESVPRPLLQIEIKEREERAKQSRSLQAARSSRQAGHESPIPAQLRTRLPSESDSELAKSDPEYREYSADDISGWEFDDLEDDGARLSVKSI
ncbi:uncharacterized protein [Oryza sativa Japonica Group]|uniref:Expressed protein n=4 Tax=Oryza TaxID=4527 RepID=Q10N63_ORYSJ|nr:polyamine-modulated factor 1-binding protein 1 [Oryza sativa Japonica Group]XP_052149514.1 uncharacterized protein LOC127768046 [Oryza glaberrima]ABF95309.1 expressed protein [Oryza sativa Japonica Group]KAF2938645.1 hypothetical protein DAI22_03g132800 [Oryza sativa Japonica Group]BAF11656.1 Os03g0281300 [Oryza sativa Japonica Group]BAS83572.1 Os03g0281300 [Oryza sativa Japonica Group]|eukprot:NP_001049742.1 Os03g0281300 [Oryza sativa Japonica Group]